MSTSLSVFLKENAVLPENTNVVVSERFVEEVEVNGKKEKKPVEWEIRAITMQEDEDIRKECTRKVQIPGKKGQYTTEMDVDKYLGKLAVECTVFPNLKDESLQDNYGILGADNLLKVMLLPGEYASYLEKIQELCGFDIPMDEKVEEVKNS